MSVRTSILKLSRNFKKLVTRINENQIALIEYIGNYFSLFKYQIIQYVKEKYDDNITTNSRVDPRAIGKVFEILNKKPTEIQIICNESNLSNTINLKSIYNQKPMAKQSRDENWTNKN